MALELWGNRETMNIPEVVLVNIQSNDYFKNHLFELKTYHEVLHEIQRAGKYLEPWVPGTQVPSSAFCLLFKLFTLKLTEKQMIGMLNYKGCNLVRAIGFLYLRFCTPPKALIDWYWDFLGDTAPVQVTQKGQPVKLGMFLRDLLTTMKWQGLILPRIPVPIAKEIEGHLRDWEQEFPEEAREFLDRPGADNH
eukprot:CAMPEP_0177677686 /NCGR_PEP_ID=MMETSP0447-20121125/28556_1 /TAXON_ID=0 /ORGANISM="Stygamoeba regulata, Strain BSH-02190019" /LENGTH=192 /DNA_ID=CAMNT_0019186535 /DNA_START=19 /DNA_END=594 /DNA_ORIENTATION=-